MINYSHNLLKLKHQVIHKTDDNIPLFISFNIIIFNEKYLINYNCIKNTFSLKRLILDNYKLFDIKPFSLHNYDAFNIINKIETVRLINNYLINNNIKEYYVVKNNEKEEIFDEFDIKEKFIDEKQEELINNKIKRINNDLIYEEFYFDDNKIIDIRDFQGIELDGHWITIDLLYYFIYNLNKKIKIFYDENTICNYIKINYLNNNHLNEIEPESIAFQQQLSNNNRITELENIILEYSYQIFNLENHIKYNQ